MNERRFFLKGIRKKFMAEHIETIIVGGGQGGLSVSYLLKQQGCEHIIFDKAHQSADAWRNRWDSFTLVTPNWMVRFQDNPTGVIILMDL